MLIFNNFYLIPVLIISLLVFWNLDSENLRDIWISLVSFAIFFSLQPQFSMCVLLVAIYLHVLNSKQLRGNISAKSLLFHHSLFLGLLFIGIGKYALPWLKPFFAGYKGTEKYFIFPLGVSYLAFRIIQYGFDSYRGSLKKHSFWKLLSFLIFTPTLPAGPLETFQNFQKQRNFNFDLTLFKRGLTRILIGFFKKQFLLQYLVIPLLNPLTKLAQNSNENIQVVVPGTAILALFGFFVEAYIDLSAYTDLALGSSALFGFRLIENFDRPFLAPTLVEFWRRWHISLSTWCRNNVFFPILAKYKIPTLALFLSMLTMGLWHDVSVNWFLWALFHTSGMLFVGYWQRHIRNSLFGARWTHNPILRPIGIVFTLLYVTIGYAFVSLDSPAKAIHWIALALIDLKTIALWTII